MRNFGLTGFLTEITHPAAMVVLVVPNVVVLAGQLFAQRCAVVEHGRDQDLRQRLRPALIMNAMREGCREPTTGALTRHDRAAWIASQVSRVIEHPLPTRLTIVETGWEPVLGRKSILGGNDRNPECVNNPPARLIIADTIGAANPAAVHSMMHKLVDRYGPERLGCHFHDTRAMGLANVYAALQAGVRQFDASAGGLGGCPFAPGAKGNVATEDVVMLCESIGYYTGLDMPKLIEAVALLSEMIGAPQGGRAHTWLSKQCA